MANSNASLSERTANKLSRLGVTASSKLLVAVSGGPDSMSLLHVLVGLRNKEFGELHVGHLNHQLREAANSDEAVVRDFCADHAISFHSRSIDTEAYRQERGVGVEEGARELRYRFFEEVANEHSIDFILTAHTANDQAETVLMNLMRGAGTRGLSGIPETRSLAKATIIRPWLDVPRSEIEEYLREYAVPHAHDASNAESIYQRNRVRNDLMPLLDQVFPNGNPITALVRTAGRMQKLDRFLTKLADEKLVMSISGDSLLLNALQNLDEFLLKLLLERWLQREGTRYSIEEEELSRIANWLKSDADRIELREGIRLRKHGNLLSGSERDYSFHVLPLSIPGSAVTPYGVINADCIEKPTTFEAGSCAYFDENAFVKKNCIVRPWKPNDRIEAFGMKGRTKLVSDVLTEAHLQGSYRKSYPVVVCDDEIVWVPGLRNSEWGRVPAGVSRVVVLSFYQNS